jgi:hypothetical protein
VGEQQQSISVPHGKLILQEEDDDRKKPRRVMREEEDEESKVLLHTGNSGEDRERQQMISPDDLPTPAMTLSSNFDTVSKKVSNETLKNRKVPDFSLNTDIYRKTCSGQ